MASNVSATPVTIRGPFTFDAPKAIQAILYVANRLRQPADMYWVLKSLYFADKHHLHRYGRFIFGYRYVAMRHGPLPSGAYDLCKIARGEGPLLQCPEVCSAFSMDGNHIIPLMDASADVFSESDLECLDEGIKECRDLSFGELKAKSHFPFTFPVELANGCVGYVPTEDAFGPHGGGYETRLTSYSNLEVSAGRQIVEAGLELAGQMTPGKVPIPPKAPPFSPASATAARGIGIHPWSYGNVPSQVD
jgi:uncharacterized phage-associated protein